jgi:hypothetical protein
LHRGIETVVAESVLDGLSETLGLAKCVTDALPGMGSLEVTRRRQAPTPDLRLCESSCTSS